MRCIICESDQKSNLYRGLVKCQRCGLVFFDGSISPEDHKKLYRESYFKGEEYFNYQEDKNILQKNFKSRLKNILRFKKQGSLFEVGCAYGYFLELAKKYFTVEGVDICERPTSFARKTLGLNVHTGNYLGLKLAEKKDVFCLWDTIEHLRNPQEFIEKISRDLKPGGYLFLTTGDIGSLMAKIRGKKWRLIHPPTHLFYFSPKTIEKLLAKYGFRIIKIKYPGIHRSSRQILYSLLYLNRKNNSEKSYKNLGLLDIPFYFNIFDIMMIIAKKI